jgi:hypothetical protein
MARAIYTEPIGHSMLMQLNYSPSVTRGDAHNAEFQRDSLTDEYVVPDTAQSSAFRNVSTAQSVGAGLRLRRGGINGALNLAYQYSTLSSDESFPAVGSISRSFEDWLPSLTFNWNAPDHRNVRLSYFTSTRAPTVSQLQNVVDNSDPLILTTGNPGLRQSTIDTFVGRFSRTDPQHSRSLFLLMSFQHTRHYIGSQTVTALADTVVAGGVLLPRGTQLVLPVNLASAWTASTFATYSRPASWLGSVLNLSAGLSYARTPGLIGTLESVSSTYVVTDGVVLASNISENLDFTVSYNGSYNLARNDLNASSRSDYYTHSLGIKFTAVTWNGFTMRHELSNALTSAVAGNVGQDVVMWNDSVGRKVFKDQRGELRLVGNDVLDQNRNVTRTITPSYVQDVNSQTLRPYVMLMLTYRLE